MISITGAFVCESISSKLKPAAFKSFENLDNRPENFSQCSHHLYKSYGVVLSSGAVVVPQEAQAHEQTTKWENFIICIRNFMVDLIS